MIPVVKICCISSIQEAGLAIKHGASAIGLVGKMPSGPGVISDDLIAEIAGAVPAEIKTFLLTSETTAKEIIKHYKKVNTTTIQLVDALHKNEYKFLRSELAHVELVQVIHVRDNKSVNEAIEISKFVDAILLDSGNPDLSVKELGGTGRTHDWNLSRRITDEVNIPVFLAGGLNARNVVEAISTVRPYGVDVCSGVRTKGRLDELKLKEFINACYPFSLGTFIK